MRPPTPRDNPRMKMKKDTMKTMTLSMVTWTETRTILSMMMMMEWPRKWILVSFVMATCSTACESLAPFLFRPFRQCTTVVVCGLDMQFLRLRLPCLLVSVTPCTAFGAFSTLGWPPLDPAVGVFWNTRVAVGVHLSSGGESACIQGTIVVELVPHYYRDCTAACSPRILGSLQCTSHGCRRDHRVGG